MTYYASHVFFTLENGKSVQEILRNHSTPNSIIQTNEEQKNPSNPCCKLQRRYLTASFF